MLDGTMDSVMQIRPDETAASQHDDWDQVGHHETAISSSMPHGVTYTVLSLSFSE